MNIPRLSSLTAIVLFVTVSCSSPTGSTTTGSTLSDPSTGFVRSAVAYDANNTKLGYCQSDGLYITVFSPQGYYYFLRWNGVFAVDSLYFTGVNAGGTAFISSMSPYYAKRVFWSANQLYTFRDVDQYGNSGSDSSITNYQSFSTESGVTNTSSTLLYPAYALKAITRATAGIPANISLPISIRYE